LLKQAGMEIIPAAIEGPVIYDPPPENMSGEVINDIIPTRNASAVTGGTAQMADSNGNVLFSVAGVGLGRVAVFTDPDLFYNWELGDVSANLTEKTALLTRLEFNIIKSLRVMGANETSIREGVEADIQIID